MFFVKFVAFSVSLKCKVEISWAFSGVFYVVVGPLGCGWEGELVAKESLVRLVGGGAPMGKKSERTAPLQTKAFDNTMGFPGEDVAAQNLL